MKRPLNSESIQQAIQKTLAAFGCQAAIVVPIWKEDVGIDTTPITIYRGGLTDEAVDEVLTVIGKNARKSRDMRNQQRKQLSINFQRCLN